MQNPASGLSANSKCARNGLSRPSVWRRCSHGESAQHLIRGVFINGVQSQAEFEKAIDTQLSLLGHAKLPTASSTTTQSAIPGHVP